MNDEMKILPGQVTQLTNFPPSTHDKPQRCVMPPIAPPLSDARVERAAKALESCLSGSHFSFRDPVGMARAVLAAADAVPVPAKMGEKEDWERTFEEFWREIVCRADGSLDIEQVKRELHDFHIVMGEVALVYDHITGGLLTKPTTEACHITDAFDDAVDKAYEEGKRDAAADAVSVPAGDWTTEPPKEPGWYWYAPEQRNYPVVPVHVHEYEGRLLFLWGVYERDISEAQGEWYPVPIVPPPGEEEGR